MVNGFCNMATYIYAYLPCDFRTTGRYFEMQPWWKMLPDGREFIRVPLDAEVPLTLHLIMRRAFLESSAHAPCPHLRKLVVDAVVDEVSWQEAQK